MVGIDGDESTRLDLESQPARKPASSIVKRLLNRSKPPSQLQLPGPVIDAITEGAQRYSDYPRTFLDDFNATKRDRKVRLGEVFDLVIRLPHTDKASNASLGMDCTLKFPGY